MSYRCQLCTAKVRHGEPRKLHTIYRPNKQIERELAVCANCAHRLGRGSTVQDLNVKAVERVPMPPLRLVGASGGRMAGSVPGAPPQNVPKDPAARKPEHVPVRILGVQPVRVGGLAGRLGKK